MLSGMRPIASLSSGLLARKGQARPAMRPQGFGGLGANPSAADDLGWNDMGAPDPVAEPVPSPALPPELPRVLVERSALQQDVARIVPPVPAAPVDEPAHLEAPVMAEAVAIERSALDLPAAKPSAIEPVGLANVRTAKAAFTLRLPIDRHLRLRLAAAVTHRSAQAIVTEALDAFLSTLPEVEELAGRCSAPDRLGNQA